MNEVVTIILVYYRWIIITQRNLLILRTMTNTLCLVKVRWRRLLVRTGRFKTLGGS